MTLNDLKQVLDGLIEEHGGDHTLFVAMSPEDDENPNLYPAEAVFTVREDEDVNGNAVYAVYISVFGLQNDGA